MAAWLVAALGALGAMAALACGSSSGGTTGSHGCPASLPQQSASRDELHDRRADVRLRIVLDSGWARGGLQGRDLGRRPGRVSRVGGGEIEARQKFPLPPDMQPDGGFLIGQYGSVSKT